MDFEARSRADSSRGTGHRLVGILGQNQRRHYEVSKNENESQRTKEMMNCHNTIVDFQTKLKVIHTYIYVVFVKGVKHIESFFMKM